MIDDALISFGSSVMNFVNQNVVEFIGFESVSYTHLYGAMLPVDGELKPTNGSVGKMVQEYFAGDRKAYDEQVPVNAIASSGTSEQALFTLSLIHI